MTNREWHDMISKLLRWGDNKDQQENIDNWTVKQPWKILKVLFFKELTFKNSKKGARQSKLARWNSQAVILTESNLARFASGSVNARISPARAREILGAHILSESLILAQDERWRRA